MARDHRTGPAPRFSILTPTRDRREFIRKAIHSVQSQTFLDWEMIIVDVGTAPVRDLLPDDPRIRYLRFESPLGPAGDFQRALEEARGEIIHPLSDDDRLPRHALETVNREIQDYEWLNARTSLCNSQGDLLHLRGGTRDHLAQTFDGSYMLGGAVYWRKTLTDRLGGFDPTYDGAADFDLYSRFIREAEPRLIKDVLYLHLVHEQQDSQANQQRQADAARRIREHVR